MGWQTDVIAAKQTDAQSIANTDSPASSYQGFTFNGFDYVQICTLLSLIETDDPTIGFDKNLDSIEIVNATEEEWPTVSIITTNQVEILADAATWNEEMIQKLANRWASTEEFEGWEIFDVSDLLQQLVDLAETAKFKKQCLLIWQSP